MKKTLEELIAQITKFNIIRRYKPRPAHSAKPIITEVSDLEEHILWEVAYIGCTRDSGICVAPGKEVRNIFWYTTTFRNATGIDLKDVLADSVLKITKQYPEAEFQRNYNFSIYSTNKLQVKN